MRWHRLLTTIACGACFAQPPQPAPPPDAPTSCPWATTPTPITPSSAGEMGDNGPWMSDDRTEVWFAQIWTTDDHDVVRTSSSAGAWGGEQTVTINNGARQDDPYIDDLGTLWYANGTVGAMTITEVARTDADIGLGTPIPHGELAVSNAVEPALAPGALVIYYSTDNATITRATRGSPQSIFTSFTQLQFARSIESPSVEANGTTIYFTDHGSNPPRIAHGEIAGDTINDEGIVGEFQNDASAQYFDPNISHDGKTLAFASTIDGSIHLYYVTRDCVPP